MYSLTCAPIFGVFERMYASSPFTFSMPATLTSVYFDHSFMAVPAAVEDRAADCLVGGHRVCAAIARANVYGCQFHPEKSGEVGLAILRAFVAQA